jgi:mRNA-degrading endonuclease YafQ of YafQ-DinJ toxin-antitoxin module
MPKFKLTPKYRRDYSKLSKANQDAVYNAKETIMRALQGDVECFNKHKLQEMEGHPGIWEGHVKINLVFTYHYDFEAGEKVYYFRRVGTHKIYKNP